MAQITIPELPASSTGPTDLSMVPIDNGIVTQRATGSQFGSFVQKKMHGFRVATTNDSVLATDVSVLYDTTSADIEATLPDESILSNGHKVLLKNLTGNNFVFLVPFSTGFIEGKDVLTLFPGEQVTLLFYDGDFFIIESGRSGKRTGDFFYAGGTSPNVTDAVECNGQLLSRSRFVGLFNEIGTAYGSGDGSTTFNAPDFRWIHIRTHGPNLQSTGSGTAGSNQATFTGHGFTRTGTRVRRLSGTLTGIAVDTNYYVIVVDADTLAFATTYANALLNTRVEISGTNSLVIQQWEDPDAASRATHGPGGNTTDSPGSRQEDAGQRITGGFAFTDNDTTGMAVRVREADGTFNVQNGTTNFINSNGVPGAITTGYRVNIDTAQVARTSTETRPSNVTAKLYIKC